MLGRRIRRLDLNPDSNGTPTLHVETHLRTPSGVILLRERERGREREPRKAARRTRREKTRTSQSKIKRDRREIDTMRTPKARSTAYYNSSTQRIRLSWHGVAWFGWHHKTDRERKKNDREACKSRQTSTKELNRLSTLSIRVVIRLL